MGRQNHVLCRVCWLDGGGCSGRVPIYPTIAMISTSHFAPNAFWTLAPPSGYALNLKILINVSYEILRDLHLKENLIRQTSFLGKNTSQKPASFRVKGPQKVGYYKVKIRHQGFPKMTKKIGHLLWMFPWPKSTLSTLLLSLPSALQTKWREN